MSWRGRIENARNDVFRIHGIHVKAWQAPIRREGHDENRECDEDDGRERPRCGWLTTRGVRVTRIRAWNHRSVRLPLTCDGVDMRMSSGRRIAFFMRRAVRCRKPIGAPDQE